MTGQDKDLWGFMIAWEFRPRPGVERRFEEAYGPQGVWARLFTRAEGFVGTKLTRDAKDASRYVTLDLWVSREAYEQFHSEYAGEYRSIDAECEGLTERETEIGRFERLG